MYHTRKKVHINQLRISFIYKVKILRISCAFTQKYTVNYRYYKPLNPQVKYRWFTGYKTPLLHHVKNSDRKMSSKLEDQRF
jgi:hypothetical protein